MLKGLAVLLTFQLAGELIAVAFQLPVSGPIIGMVLLTMWLQANGRIDDGLASTGDGLLPIWRCCLSRRRSRNGLS